MAINTKTPTKVLNSKTHFTKYALNDNKKY